MTAIDATGVHALENLADRLKKSGRILLLCGSRAQPRVFLRQAEFVAHIGAENILPHLRAALGRAEAINERFQGVGEEFAHDIRKTSL
jgi:SulP family sulfate permease